MLIYVLCISWKITCSEENDKTVQIDGRVKFFCKLDFSMTKYRFLVGRIAPLKVLKILFLSF